MRLAASCRLSRHYHSPVMADQHDQTDAAPAGFQEALRAVLRAEEQTQEQIAGKAGISSQLISDWKAFRSSPRPDDLFRLEQALGLAPGHLSRHLGYVPAGTLPVEEAISGDPWLEEGEKSVLLRFYHGIVIGRR